MYYIYIYMYVYLFCHAIVLVFRSSLLRSKPSKCAHSIPRKPNGNVTDFGCPHYQAYNCQELEPERPMCHSIRSPAVEQQKRTRWSFQPKRTFTIHNNFLIWYCLIIDLTGFYQITADCIVFRMFLGSRSRGRLDFLEQIGLLSDGLMLIWQKKNVKNICGDSLYFFADGQKLQKARKSKPLSQAGMCLIIPRLRLTPVWLLQFFWVISPQHKAKGAIWMGRVPLQWTSKPKESLLRICCVLTLDMSNSWNQKKAKLPDRVQGIRGRPRLVHDSQPQAQWQ